MALNLFLRDEIPYTLLRYQWVGESGVGRGTYEIDDRRLSRSRPIGQ
jgi:hypothetical protein